MNLKQLEKIAKALSDSNRLKILDDMCKHGGTIQCAQIATLLNLAQPSVSHHIKNLIEAGIIESEKDGRNYSYKINAKILSDYATKIAALSQFGKIK